MGPTSQFMSYRKVTVALLALLASVISCLAQSDAAAKAGDEKAEQVVQKAIQAIGGDAYLNVKTVIGRGFYTSYHGGVSGVPLRFVDYIAYPDRERTEFTGEGNRIIQTNYQNEGWMFDAAAKSLKDQTAKQIEDFRTGMRTSMENLLRGWWRKEGARLSYVGRREATLGRRNEAVRLTYPDGFWIEYEFAAVEGTPAKAIYKRKQKNPDTDEMFETTEEDRFFKAVAVSGVSAPFVIDHFRNGVQTSRINYESIEFNKPLADSLFAKPANIKAIK
jgi:outer membrane lipoprotein-sorting protein